MVTSKQKIETQPEPGRNVLRSIREVAANIRRDKPGVVAYIEKNFKVTPSVAAEAYEDINGVIIESLGCPKSNSRATWTRSRGRDPKPLTVGDAFDLSLMRSLK